MNTKLAFSDTITSSMAWGSNMTVNATEYALLDYGELSNDTLEWNPDAANISASISVDNSTSEYNMSNFLPSFSLSPSKLSESTQLFDLPSTVDSYFTSALPDVNNQPMLLEYNQTKPELDIMTTVTTIISFVTTTDSQEGASLVALLLKTVSLVLISLSGVSGNGFIIYTIVKEGNLHRPPFYYLLSLCVSDLSRAVFCVPLVLMTVLQGSVWKYGSSACKLFAFANSFFIYSSSAAVLAIAIDRHFSIVYSKIYKRRSRGLVNLIVVVVGWTIAFAMSFPPVVGIGTYVFIADESQCTFHHKYYKANDTLGFVLVFSLIVFVSVFLYFRVFSFLRRHRKMRPLEHQPARSSNWTFFGPGANGQALVNVMNGFGANPALNPLRMQVRPNFGRVVNLHTVKNEHLTRLFFVVTCVFCSLWFPYIVLAFWRMFDKTGNIASVFVTLSAWLTYTQVALCPLLYILSRGPIRKHSRTVVDANDKKEFLLETRNRK